MIDEDTGKLLPTALATSTAATELSTPPDRPQRTFLSPTCARTFATAPSHKGGHCQSPVAAAYLEQEPPQHLPAVFRMHDFRVELHCVQPPRWVLHRPRPGQWAVRPWRGSPAGTAAIRSVWLMKQSCSGSRPRNRRLSGSVSLTRVAPYSLAQPGSSSAPVTRPPSR